MSTAVARAMRVLPFWNVLKLQKPPSSWSIRCLCTTSALKQLDQHPAPIRSEHVTPARSMSDNTSSHQKILGFNLPPTGADNTAQVGNGSWTASYGASISTPRMERHRFPSVWLRDHCQCSTCLHPQTKQRQVDTFSIPSEPETKSVSTSTEGLTVVWGASEEHTSFYPWSWLVAHSPFKDLTSSRVTTAEFTYPKQDAQSHKPAETAAYPSVNFQEIMTTSSGLLSYLQQIYKHGLCFATETRRTREATEALLNRISFIRPTHYGAFWDFTSISNPTDTAYTTLALPAHTDTTYFTDPCGLQMFHLLSHTDGDGGESIFVDGFAVAEYLHDHHPQAYQVLSEVPVVSHASGDRKAGVIVNTAMKRGYPVLNHDYRPDNAISGYHPRNLRQIRWNNDDRSPLTRFGSLAQMKAWYDAARQWTKLLKEPNFETVIQLQPGNPVIFDNWRILHGRRAFTGKRSMCGGYIGMDDFLGRIRGLKEELGEQDPILNDL